jgi:hypothetical protein
VQLQIGCFDGVCEHGGTLLGIDGVFDAKSVRRIMIEAGCDVGISTGEGLKWANG